MPYNPMGLFVYVEDVDAVARTVGLDAIIGKKGPSLKPWGVYEFAMNDPDQTLVRIGRRVAGTPAAVAEGKAAAGVGAGSGEGDSSAQGGEASG